MTQQTKAKKKDKILIGAVVILALALIFETVYLVKLKKGNNEPSNIKSKDAISTLLRSPLTGASVSLLDLRQWDPFFEMERMQERINRIFRDTLHRSSFDRDSGDMSLGVFYEPDLDIQDKSDYYLIKMDIPGMEKDRINIEVNNHSIIISGERNFQEEQKDDKKGFYRMERRTGSFYRAIPLPEDAVSEGMNAQYEKGVLKIKVAKKPESKAKTVARKIQIQ